MKKKELNEAQAWREIATRIEKKTWEWRGLCAEVDRLGEQERITWDTQRSMEDRVREHEYVAGTRDDGPDWPYAFPPGESATRILAANFLALEAADEARAAR